MRRSTCLFFMLCLAHLGYAQGTSVTPRDNFKATILRMQEEYRKLEKLHLVMAIDVFENASTTKPYFSETADIRRYKHNYLYKFAGHELMMNDKYMVMVDHTSKEILCNTTDQGKESDALRNGFQWNVDSLLQFYGEAVYLGRQGDIDHYRIPQKVGEVETVEMYIDSSNAVLSRIDYTYRNGQYVKIVFRVFNRVPSFDASLFSERNYVVMQKEKAVASAKYRGFRVTDAQQQETK